MITTKQDQVFWTSLENGIDKLMNRNDQGLSFDKYAAIYTGIYNYLAGSAAKIEPEKANQDEGFSKKYFLYSNLKDYLRRYLEELLSRCKNLENEQLLGLYRYEWNKYTTGSKYIHNVFRYLNRHWMNLDHPQRFSKDVYSLCIAAWRDVLFMKIQNRLICAVLHITENDRNGQPIDCSLIKNLSSSCVVLGLDETEISKSSLNFYRSYLEDAFIKSTEMFYRIESKRTIAQLSPSEYCKNAQQRIKEEEQRVYLCFDERTMEPLIKSCETTFIEDHKDTLLEFFKKMLTNGHSQDLGRVYKLLVRVKNGLGPLKLHFEKYVNQIGIQAIDRLPKNTDSDTKDYVDQLLKVYQYYYEMVVSSFENDPGFIGSLDKAFRDLVNRNSFCASSSSKSPEMLVRYVDSVLKKGALNDIDLEECLQKTILVFKYIEDKDVFQEFYSKMLAKRLILDLSHSESAERSMIEKLKAASGFEYTSKLMRMFTDISISRDLNELFQRKAPNFCEDEFSMKVLGSGSWPLHAATTELNLSPEMELFYNSFNDFYHKQYSGRKLQWLFHTSCGELKTIYLTSGGKGGYIFQLYTFAMVILLLFNNEDKIAISNISQKTRLSLEMTRSQIEILVKSKVLSFTDNSPQGLASDTSEVELNYNFKHKKHKVNLKLQIKSDDKNESEETHNNVEEDRKLLIQASIMRTTKTKKVIKHLELVQAVIDQLSPRFKPKINDIKKCVDILLEKEYIERMEGEKDTYSYVA
jgi:cullin 1